MKEEQQPDIEDFKGRPLLLKRLKWSKVTHTESFEGGSFPKPPILSPECNLTGNLDSQDDSILSFALTPQDLGFFFHFALARVV